MVEVNRVEVSRLLMKEINLLARASLALYQNKRIIHHVSHTLVAVTKYPHKYLKGWEFTSHVISVWAQLAPFLWDGESRSISTEGPVEGAQLFTMMGRGERKSLGTRCTLQRCITVAYILQPGLSS